MVPWQIRQLEKLGEVEPTLVDEAFERLLALEPTLRERVVIGAYLDRDINFGKAAELMGVHPVALRKDFLGRGIPVRIGSETVEDLRAEVTSAAEL